MAIRTRIPIDKNFQGAQKEKYDAVDRLLKERYATPIYDICEITDFVFTSNDPLNTGEIKRKIIAQKYSDDKSKQTSVGPNKEDYDDGHEDVTSYIIGVKRNGLLSEVLKKGDIIEVEIVSNDITKKNNIDGFYVSTLKDSEGFYNYIEGAAYPIVDMFNSIENRLSNEEIEQIELTEEILKTKKEVDSYKSGRLEGKIEVVTSPEGKQVEINTYKVYIAMKNAAAKEGINLSIRSGYRSMNEQIKIYNNRYEPDYAGGGSCKNKGENISGTFKKAVKVSSEGVVSYPGCSNHQNGKALDIVNEPYANVVWLMRNANRFGFFNTVKSENWHWEYLG